MKIITALQGSPDWLAERAAPNTFTASELSAAAGESKYVSRAELLKQKATGLSKDIDSNTQSLFNKGHAAEFEARKIAEKIIGDELSPMTGYIEVEGMRLLASFDGITFDDETLFEHKLYSEQLAAQVRAGELERHYTLQLDQQLMVSGAKKVLFMTSDGTEENMAYMWYEQSEGFDHVLATWRQFAIDLKNYVHVEVAEMPKAEVVIELPALFIHAKGEITDDNLEAFGIALTAKLAEVRAIKLITDQDFSNAKAAASMFREQCKKLVLTKEAMLSQTVSIGEAARMMDAWHEDLRQTALQLEKNVEKEDMAKKSVMLSEAVLAFSAHIESLESETRPIQLNVLRPDFAAAIKNKRNYTSMQDAVDTALANGKIAADAVAKDIRAKQAWFFSIDKDPSNVSWMFLFADLQQIITKPLDDFKLLVTSRIETHKKAEAEKIERIRAEEQVKAEAAAKAKIEAEARAKAEQEASELAEQKRKEELATHVTQSEPVSAKPAPSVRPVATWPFPMPATADPAYEKSTAGKDSRPTDVEIIRAIIVTFNCTNEQACEWIRHVAESMAVAA